MCITCHAPVNFISRTPGHMQRFSWGLTAFCLLIGELGHYTLAM